MTVTSFPTTASGLASFKAGYAKGVARAMNISSDDVTVTSASLVARRERRKMREEVMKGGVGEMAGVREVGEERGRELASVSVLVLYVVKVSEGTSYATLASTLLAVQSSGALNNALVSSGIPGAVTAVPAVVNISPSAAPTYIYENGGSRMGGMGGGMGGYASVMATVFTAVAVLMLN